MPSVRFPDFYCRQERLIQEHELPEVYRMEHESQVVVDEVFEDRRSRNKTAVHYDDGLSEEQWVQVSTCPLRFVRSLMNLQAVEQEQDPEEVAQMNRQRKAAARAAKPAGNISSPGSGQGAASDDDDSRGKRKRNGQSSSPSFGEEDDDDHSGVRSSFLFTIYE